MAPSGPSEAPAGPHTPETPTSPAEPDTSAPDTHPEAPEPDTSAPDTHPEPTEPDTSAPDPHPEPPEPEPAPHNSPDPADPEELTSPEPATDTPDSPHSPEATDPTPDPDAPDNPARSAEPRTPEPEPAQFGSLDLPDPLGPRSAPEPRPTDAAPGYDTPAESSRPSWLDQEPDRFPADLPEPTSEPRAPEPRSADASPHPEPDTPRSSPEPRRPDAVRRADEPRRPDDPGESREPQGPRSEPGPRDDLRPERPGPGQPGRAAPEHDGPPGGPPEPPEPPGAAGRSEPGEPKPNLRDLFPQDGMPFDKERLLPQFRQAIEGEYRGLRVEIHDVNFDIEKGRLHVEIKFTDQIGRHAGLADRFYFKEGDNLIAHHELSTLRPQFQGNGFAKEWQNSMFDWYRQSGVAESRLLANIDVGSYAFARQGFEFADQAEAVELIRPRLENELSNARSEVEQLARDRDSLPVGPERDALVKQIKEHSSMIEKGEKMLDDFRVGSPDFPTPRAITELGRPAGLLPGQSEELSYLGKRVFMEFGERISWHGKYVF